MQQNVTMTKCETYVQAQEYIYQLFYDEETQVGNKRFAEPYDGPDANYIQTGTTSVQFVKQKANIKSWNVNC